MLKQYDVKLTPVIKAAQLQEAARLQAEQPTAQDGAAAGQAQAQPPQAPAAQVAASSGSDAQQDAQDGDGSSSEEEEEEAEELLPQEKRAHKAAKEAATFLAGAAGGAAAGAAGGAAAVTPVKLTDALHASATAAAAAAHWEQAVRWDELGRGVDAACVIGGCLAQPDIMRCLHVVEHCCCLPLYGCRAAVK
jgi:hypothetical protein